MKMKLKFFSNFSTIISIVEVVPFSTGSTCHVFKTDGFHYMNTSKNCSYEGFSFYCSSPSVPWLTNTQTNSQRTSGSMSKNYSKMIRHVR